MEPAAAPLEETEAGFTNDTPDAPEAADSAPVALPEADEAPSTEDTSSEPLAQIDSASILASNQVQNDTRDWLVRYLIDTANLDAETAVQASLRAVNALNLPEPEAKPERPARQPRTGTKQDIVIELLRRPEGVTIAQMIEATGWQSHTCRGVLAGALKKRLGLTITSDKPDSSNSRVYRLA